jgi:hypothetical protein
MTTNRRNNCSASASRFVSYNRDASINVNATANAQAGAVVISEEKRRKLQEQFAKWQEERAAAEEAEIERRVQERLKCKTGLG